MPGSYAVMGVPSIAVVANKDLWIEANFKETELTRVRVGQPVNVVFKDTENGPPVPMFKPA